MPSHVRKVEKRAGGFRRSVNSLAMRDGQTQESKLFSTVGKLICIWLLLKYSTELISHAEALLVLIGLLIVPDIAKKMITMKFNGHNGRNENWRGSGRIGTR